MFHLRLRQKHPITLSSLWPFQCLRGARSWIARGRAMLRPADSTCLFCDPRAYATTTQLLAGVQTVSQGANPRGSSSLSGEKRDPSPDAVLTSAPDTWPPGAAPE